MTTHPAEIGSSAIDKTDPYELTERIQYMVRHEMLFAEYQEMLETLLRYQEGHDWTRYEKFLVLLNEYRRELDAGSVHANEKRVEVVAYSAHREGGKS